MNNHCIQELKDKLEQIKIQYNIQPVFVGLFGSQCKGYAGSESDYDFYVPYIGPIGKYLQAVAVDTLQVEDKEKLPPQISFEITDGEKVRKIQLNFVDFPNYIRELTCANIDFNLALDNPYVIYCSKSVLDLIRYLAKVQFNLEKVKHASLSRVRKTIAELKAWGNPESKAMPPHTSEIADGMYRMLFAAGTTHSSNVHIRSFFDYPVTMTRLLEHYLSDCGLDVEIELVFSGILKDIKQGKWKDTAFGWKDRLISVLEEMHANVAAKDIVHLQGNPAGIPINERMAIYVKINSIFTELVLEAHNFKTVDKTQFKEGIP